MGDVVRRTPSSEVIPDIFLSSHMTSRLKKNSLHRVLCCFLPLRQGLVNATCDAGAQLIAIIHTIQFQSQLSREKKV